MFLAKGVSPRFVAVLRFVAVVLRVGDFALKSKPLQRFVNPTVQTVVIVRYRAWPEGANRFLGVTDIASVLVATY